MDWFERLTGFRETGYHDTRAKLKVDGSRLKSVINGKDYGIGELELVSLQALRERVQSGGGLPGRLKASAVTGDVRQMHQSTENAGAVFQVASQFNLLEMVSPTVTPEHGVTRYQDDRTQGPACAIAAGAATIYRNYFAPLGQSAGQTTDRQFNGLADLGTVLGAALSRPIETLWNMQNGYALCTRSGLDAITEHLGKLQPDQIDILGRQPLRERFTPMRCARCWRRAALPISRSTRTFVSTRLGIWEYRTVRRFGLYGASAASVGL
jgi:hypothetical protein